MTCIYCNDDPVARVNCYCRRIDKMRFNSEYPRTSSPVSPIYDPAHTQPVTAHDSSLVLQLQMVGRALRNRTMANSDPCDEWAPFERQWQWTLMQRRLAENSRYGKLKP